MIKFNILPSFYIFVIVFVLTLFFLITGLFFISKSRFRVATAAVFSVIMCVVLSVASFKYIIPAMDTLEKITTKKQTYLATYHILTKADPCMVNIFYIGLSTADSYG